MVNRVSSYFPKGGHSATELVGLNMFKHVSSFEVAIVLKKKEVSV